ncbi:MAG: hypothetical protein ALECFALPRED_003388 [Alectoria fallacina]|uniref:Ribosomal protein L33 n=1 Tax=Alectoria fallacina TaxID=1903189 RepID=A0A8H3FKC7_9LECA|nr:MAG: hypothetical protein ALECFALPRED_003388 [Alectoria fallacina]
MALTGYYRTLRRPRAHRPLSMLKYDPVGTSTLPLATILAGFEKEGREGKSLVADEGRSKKACPIPRAETWPQVKG